MIYSVIDEYRFIDAMMDQGFSHEASRIMYEWYEELSDDCGDIQFDPIGFRCEWTEYDSMSEAYRDAGAREIASTIEEEEEQDEELQESLRRFMIDCNNCIEVFFPYNGHVLVYHG